MLKKSPYKNEKQTFIGFTEFKFINMGSIDVKFIVLDMCETLKDLTKLQVWEVGIYEKLRGDCILFFIV